MFQTFKQWRCWLLEDYQAFSMPECLHAEPVFPGLAGSPAVVRQTERALSVAGGQPFGH